MGHERKSLNTAMRYVHHETCNLGIHALVTMRMRQRKQQQQRQQQRQQQQKPTKKKNRSPPRNKRQAK